MHRNRDGMCDIFAVINNKCKNKTSSPVFLAHNYLAQNAFGTVNKLTSESNLLPPVIMMAFLDAQGVFCFLRSRAFCTLLPIQATTTTKPLRSLDRSSERKKKSGPRAPVSFSSSATCKTSALRVVILLFSSSTPLIVPAKERISDHQRQRQQARATAGKIRPSDWSESRGPAGYNRFVACCRWMPASWLVAVLFSSM